MSMRDKLKSTLNIVAPSHDQKVDLSTFKPRTAPGIEHDNRKRLQAALAENEALKSQKVRVADLIEVEGRRRSLTQAQKEELKLNIQNNGLIHKIVVRPDGKGCFEIIAGHNRVDAYKALGLEEIEADIKDIDEEHVLQSAFYSNLFNSPLSDYEKYCGFKVIQEKTGEIQEQLAVRAGVSKMQISALFGFGKLPARAIEMIRENPHCIGYNAVSKMVARENVATNSEAIITAIERLSRDEITEAIAVTLATRKPTVKLAPQKMAPVKIGTENFAEFTIRKDRLVIDFKDSEKSAQLMGKIRDLIESEVKSSS